MYYLILRGIACALCFFGSSKTKSGRVVPTDSKTKNHDWPLLTENTSCIRDGQSCRISREDDKKYLQKKMVRKVQPCVFLCGHNAQPCQNNFSKCQKPNRKSLKTQCSGCCWNQSFSLSHGASCRERFPSNNSVTRESDPHYGTKART